MKMSFGTAMSRHPLHALLIQPHADHVRAGGAEGRRGAGIAGILDPDVVAGRDTSAAAIKVSAACALGRIMIWSAVGANAPAGREIMRQRLAQARAG